MNQTNPHFTQWKNLTDEQRGEHDFENYKYEIQRGVSFGPWVPCSPSDNLVYRLVIERNMWYCIGDDREVALGRDIIGPLSQYPILRPAKPSDFPKNVTIPSSKC